MNIRNIIEFLKKPSSKLVLMFVLVFVSIVYLAPGISKMLIQNSKGKQMKLPHEDMESNLQTDIKPWDGVNFDDFSSGKSLKNPKVAIKKYSAGINKLKSKTAIQKNKNKALSKRLVSAEKSSLKTAVENFKKSATAQLIQPLNIYNSGASVKKLYTDILPYGRLIPCELVITLISSNSGTPIIGIVTENIYNDGKLMIPAGTEVHGETQGMPLLDHIRTSEKWALVWRTGDKDNGRALKVRGLALENGSHWNGRNWDLSDGSNGIKGYVTNRRNSVKLKEIAAQISSGAVSGIASAAAMGAALIPGGSGSTGNMIGAGGKGVSTALSSAAGSSAQIVAEQALINEMESNYFITCPSGTQFYLYVKDMINLENARVGGAEG